MEEVCLVHDTKWRGRFQHMLNKLRTEFLPPTCIRDFQTLTCSCQRGKHTVKEDAKLMSQNVFDKYQGKRNFDIPTDFDFSTISTLPEPVEIILQELSTKNIWSIKCNHDNSGCKCSRSVKLMLYLISLVAADDLNFVNQAEDGSRTRKTDGYTFTKQLRVDNLRPEHVGLMIGSKGKNIRKIEQKYKCVVRLNKLDDQHVLASVKSKRVILDKIMASLSLEARKIADKRLQHETRVARFTDRKSRRKEPRRKQKVREVDEDGWTTVH